MTIATATSTLGSIGKATGGSSILRGLSLVSNMFETTIERLEHEQQLDQPLALAERDLKRTARSIEIEDARAAMLSRVKAASITRQLASVNAELELSKTELDLFIATNTKMKYAVLKDNSIPMSARLAKIQALDAEVKEHVAAYNTVFKKASEFKSLLESEPVAQSVDYSQYATVTDTVDEEFSV